MSPGGPGTPSGDIPHPLGVYVIYDVFALYPLIYEGFCRMVAGGPWGRGVRGDRVNPIPQQVLITIDRVDGSCLNSRLIPRDEFGAPGHPS